MRSNGCVVERFSLDRAADDDECELLALRFAARYDAPLTPAQLTRRWLLTLRTRVRSARARPDWSTALPLPGGTP